MRTFLLFVFLCHVQSNMDRFHAHLDSIGAIINNAHSLLLLVVKFIGIGASGL